MIISPTFNGMGALKQQEPTERPDRQASIATYLMHLHLNDLWDHAAERACDITAGLRKLPEKIAAVCVEFIRTTWLNKDDPAGAWVPRLRWGSANSTDIPGA